MLLKIIICIISVIAFVITFKQNLKISRIKKDTTKKVVCTNSNLLSMIWYVYGPGMALFTILNVFTTNYSPIHNVLQLWWILLIPNIWKIAKENLIVLDSTSISVALDKKIDFKDITKIDYKNDPSSNTMVDVKAIILTLINGNEMKIKFRDEYEAINLYKKLNTSLNLER